MPRLRGKSSLLIAWVTLTLGIGAATALFSVVYAVLLRPLAIPHPRQVLFVSEGSREAPGLGVSYPDFLDFQSSSHDFSSLVAIRPSDMALNNVGPPAMVIGARVTGAYFSLLGARPWLGRTFLSSDEQAGAPAVVVLSSQFFQQRLGGDRTWLGRTLDLDGVARIVIGVMPPGVGGLLGSSPQAQPLFWTPLGPYAAGNPLMRRRDGRSGNGMLGRMRPGVTLASARADLAGVAAHLAQRYPATNEGITVTATPFLESLTASVRPALWGLLAATMLLLLLACANVANLLLARATVARHEDALRAALGASPARLLGRRVRESLGLGVAGAAAGIGLAALMLQAVPTLLPDLLPRGQQVALDVPVLLFAVVLAVLCALLAGLAPALGSSRTPPAAALLPPSVLNACHTRGRSLLVACQMALALLLLAGSALLLRSLARLQAVNPGFQPQGVLSFIIGLPTTTYKTRARQLEYFHQADLKLQHLPGVEAAGGAFPMPFTLGGLPQPVTIVGRAQPPAGQTPSTDVVNVRGNYFAAIGMHLLGGRAFTPNDGINSTPVAIVDARFVQQFWPKQRLQAALGQRIHLAGVERTVVGVVAQVQESSLAGTQVPETYIPQDQAQRFANVLYFALRGRVGTAMSLRSAAMRQLATLDAAIPITDVQTMGQRIEATLAQRQMVLALLGAFAVLALILSAIGVYGVLSYVVARRRREIGVRMALGASRGQVLAQVLADGMKPALAGTAAGLIATLALSRLLASFLYGVGSHDPLSLAAAALLLLAIAALACLLPALRASHLDPATALRTE